MSRFLSFAAALLLTVPLVAQTGADFERILLPVFTPPVHGAFGSEFHTELRAWNDSGFTLTDDENFGTEMPIVRDTDFRTNRLVLLGVPTDPKFRNTLRIYSPELTNVLVTIDDRPPVRVSLAGGADIFSPAFAMFSDFPSGTDTVRVTIDVESLIISLLPIETPVWAFITVTNNDTQVISTITPQP